MQRNIKTDVVILKTRRVGDYNKSVTCLSPDIGIVDALVYGAYRGKSRLSGVTDILSVLSVNFYYNPVKKTYKVIDAAEKIFFSSIKEDLDRFYRASLFSEIVLISCGGGGSHERMFRHFVESLFQLDTSEKEKIDLVVIQFLWRFLILSGLDPSLVYCSECGKAFEGGSSIYLEKRDNAFVCSTCKRSDSPVLNAGGLRYLVHSRKFGMEAALRVGLERKSCKYLRDFLLVMIQNFLEKPLYSRKYF